MDLVILCGSHNPRGTRPSRAAGASTCHPEGYTVHSQHQPAVTGWCCPSSLPTAPRLIPQFWRISFQVVYTRPPLLRNHTCHNQVNVSGVGPKHNNNCHSVKGVSRQSSSQKASQSNPCVTAHIRAVKVSFSEMLNPVQLFPQVTLWRRKRGAKKNTSQRKSHPSKNLIRSYFLVHNYTIRTTQLHQSYDRQIS